MQKYLKLFLLIILIVPSCYISSNTTKFNTIFEKMKKYYKDPNNNKNDFFYDLESIIAVDSSNEYALSNSVYYLLSRNDSLSLEKCNDYIIRLIKSNPHNPLYAILKFRLYEKIVINYVNYGDIISSSTLFNTALDSFIIYSNKLSHDYKDVHFVRLNILWYLDFDNFSEAELYLVKSLIILGKTNYKKNLLKIFNRFIGLNVVDDLGVYNIPYLNEKNIEHYLHNFYTSPSRDYIRKFYKLNILVPRNPEINLFPLKYHNYLEKLIN